jgi:hypothetical protein
MPLWGMSTGKFWVLSSELEDGASALVYLVCLVHFVRFVQLKNQTNKTSHINKPCQPVYPQTGLLLKMPYRFNRSHQLLVRNRLCALFDSIILQALHKEPAMNGAPGFQEVRLLSPDHQQIGSCTSNGLRSETVPDTVSSLMKLYRVMFMLLIFLLSIESASSQETDTILIQNNEPEGEIGIWISEPDNGRPKGTPMKVTSVHTGQSITGSFSGEPGAIVAFAENRVPTLKQRLDWSGGQTVHLPLESPVTISLRTWVAAGNFNNVRDAMTHAITWVNGMFRREHQGITISLPDNSISDVTNTPTIRADRYKNMGTAFTCPGTIKEDIGFVQKSINIYIVKAVHGDNGPSGTAGVYCPSEKIIVIAIGEDNDMVHLGGLLAHELGHLLSLEHRDTSFGETNVMVASSTTRAFLTEGQTFRAIYQQASELNNSLNDPPHNRTTLTCPENYGNTTSYNCPPLDLRIWNDISSMAHTPGPVTNDPFRVALKKYLHEDHKDFFDMKAEMAQKGEKSETLKRLLELSASDPNFNRKKLESLLIEILNKQLGKNITSEFLSEYDAFLTDQWESREQFLKNKHNIKRLGFTKRQLKLVTSLTREQYEKRGLDGLKRRYQEKAVIALGAIGSQGKTALREFKTDDKGLQDSIDYQLEKPGIITKPDIGHEILERHD